LDVELLAKGDAPDGGTTVLTPPSDHAGVEVGVEADVRSGVEAGEQAAGLNMDKILIRGGRKLSGTIKIGGAKNAALPLMAASLLSEEPLTLGNMPELADIRTLGALLEQHGVAVRKDGGSLSLDGRNISNTTAPYDLVRKMRASVLVLGPLLARTGTARVSLPGGCAIGARPVDLHLKALTQMGADISVDQGYIQATAPGGLTGAHIVFPQVSVGATENILLAATLARGETVLENAAREPEIADLAECLIAMGAKIEGVGTDRLSIEGVDGLQKAEHDVMPDRIEAGTYALAVAATGGTVVLEGARLDHIDALAHKMREAGAVVEERADGIFVDRDNRELLGMDVMTEPYPGFPTDLQAQFMAMMTCAKGASMITETIFENRFMHVPELQRMGANINLHGSSAMVRGVETLTGAPIMASDLRASASLVVAGLVAEGETEIARVYHLDRGYEQLEEKLTGVGGDVERVSS
jgi:UDP-N-acetylglucosamine 1-carboxyvinyltransferase